MMQHPPFEILVFVDLEKFNLDNYRDDGPIGSFLELDVDYPDQLHDLHNNYSLAGAKVKIAKKKCFLNINYKLWKIVNFLLATPLS